MLAHLRVADLLLDGRLEQRRALLQQRQERGVAPGWTRGLRKKGCEPLSDRGPRLLERALEILRTPIPEHPRDHRELFGIHRKVVRLHPGAPLDGMLRSPQEQISVPDIPRLEIRHEPLALQALEGAERALNTEARLSPAPD